MSHHHHHPSHPQHSNPKKPLHRSPLVVAGAILMLVAILLYVFTLDESEVPVTTPVPATANP